MSTENWFTKTLEGFKDDEDFLAERAILEFTEQVAAAMHEAGMSRADLARKLGVSKAFVTKLLNGNPNLTIRTMVALAKALDCSLNLNLYPRDLQLKTVNVRPKAAPYSPQHIRIPPVRRRSGRRDPPATDRG